jgi:hypothetical protein
MNKQLESLIQLQQIDLKILAFRRMIEEFPRKIREAEAPLQGSRDVLNTIKMRFETLEKKKREKERAVEEVNERIGKLKAKTADIKTNKEYQALLKEIESVEHDRSSIEDEILAIMEDTDAIGKQVKAEEKNFSRNVEKVETLKKTIEQEKAILEKDMMAVQATRAAASAALDTEVYDEYIALLEICHGHAVNEVKEEICQGCNMNIPPQLFVEIKKNEEIYHCPHCRRILFYKEISA